MDPHVTDCDLDDFLGRQTQIGLPLADDQERIRRYPIFWNDALRVETEGVGQSPDQIFVRLSGSGSRTGPALGLVTRASVRPFRVQGWF